MIKINLYPVNIDGERFPIQFYRPESGNSFACSFLSHVLGKTYVDEEDSDYLRDMAKLHNVEVVVNKPI